MKTAQRQNRQGLIPGSIAAVLLCITMVSCTESPFGEDINAPRSSMLTGTVTLSNQEDPSGVYIWLEGSDIKAFSDGSGSFQLELPPSLSATSGAQNGIYNLYFYVANYQISSSSVVIQDGQFLGSRGDLNGSAELVGTKSMVKLLNIETSVEPDTIDENFEGMVHFSVFLQALFDSVEVSMPKLDKGLPQAVLIRNLDTGEVTVCPQSPPEADFLETKKIGPEITIIEHTFELNANLLPIGEYSVIPFILIRQENLPEDLLSSLGFDIEDINSSFANIPFKRSGGKFVVDYAD